MSESIGLSELIKQVKNELLSDSISKNDSSLLFIESVELELHVVARREGNLGVKIDVLSIGGGNTSGSISQEDSHIIKVKLSPLFEKEKLLEWYKDLHSDKIVPTINSSLNAFVKGKLDIDTDSRSDA